MNAENVFVFVVYANGILALLGLASAAFSKDWRAFVFGITGLFLGIQWAYLFFNENKVVELIRQIVL